MNLLAYGDSRLKRIDPAATVRPAPMPVGSWCSISQPGTQEMILINVPGFLLKERVAGLAKVGPAQSGEKN